MIRITHTHAKQLRFHAEKSYPEECCGALFGICRDGIISVHEIMELQNSQEVQRDQRYLISAERYREVERIAKQKNVELIGFYHSHPDRSAQPSIYDIENALPWFVYIIISVIRCNADQISAWVLSENRQRFYEQQLIIE